MAITGPAPITTASQASAPFTFTYDSETKTYAIIYAALNGVAGKRLSGGAGAALQTAINARVAQSIEVAEGWANGSSVIT
jgi:hypothetical protein